MFGWFGNNKKREDEWMKQPRRMPDGEEQPVSERENDRWIFSREFARADKKYERMYAAADRMMGSDGIECWKVCIYSYDVRDDSGDINVWTSLWCDSAREVIDELREFEQSRRETEKFVPVECAPPTYKGFANRNGIHFDDAGNVFTVETEQPLAKDVFMNRKSLDALFHKAEQKPIESWQDVYDELVNKWPDEWTVMPQEQQPLQNKLSDAFNGASNAETPAPASVPAEEAPAEKTPIAQPRPVTLEDLAQDPAYAEFAYHARAMVKDLQKVPELLFGTQANKPKAMNVRLSGQRDIMFDASSKAKLAQRLADASMLVALMRAGAAAYADVFSGKQPMDTQHLEIIGKVGEACAEIAEKRFGLSPEQAKKVADVLSKGADPFGPALPIETLFEKFPPADYAPPPRAVKIPKRKPTGF